MEFQLKRKLMGKKGKTTQSLDVFNCQEENDALVGTLSFSSLCDK